MKPKNKHQRRILFTNDAKLAIRRKPAATMASASEAPAEPAAEELQVTLEGYAIVWNALSDDRGGFRVRLLPGSAKFVDRVHALFHHDYKAILGATENATLRISSDNVGVKVEIDLPDTCCARDVAELVEDKYVRGMSFSMLFDPAPESSTKNEGDIEIEEVSSFWCDEITVTAIPSFTTTSICLQDEVDPDDAAESPAATPATETVTASARTEQTIRLEQLRLANLEI